MIKKVGIIISLLSIFVAIAVILWFYIKNGFPGLQGAGWILAILGAPTTFLSYFPYKFGLSKGLIVTLSWIIFFYILQYQMIALWVHKALIGNKAKIPIRTIILVTFMVTAIVLSGCLMWNLIMGCLR